MASRKMTQFEELMVAINGIQTEVASIRADVDALKGKTAKTTKNAKSAPKKTVKTKTSTKTAKKSGAKTTAPKTEPKTVSTASTKLADFEPCKFKDTNNYVWGGVKGYKAMRSAYCYAKQTKGQARNLAEAKKLGFEIDFDKAWAKAKAEFEKKYVYVKAEDRA